MCHKSPERNCVKATFDLHVFRKWQHFCFTGGFSSEKHNAGGNFTLRGYINGRMIGSGSF